MKNAFKFSCLICLTIFFACKKENGRFFLRVIIPTDTTIKQLAVSDANKSIPVDCSYYPVDKHLEISYVLSHVKTHQIINWTASMPWHEFDYEDVSIHEYLGEFEKDTKDKYYTLVVGYAFNQSEPIYNKWATPAYYFYSFDYFNQCNLTWSYQPESSTKCKPVNP
jgi:hypothetical protein